MNRIECPNGCGANVSPNQYNQHIAKCNGEPIADQRRKWKYLTGKRGHTYNNRGSKQQRLDRSGNPIEFRLEIDDLNQLLSEAGITMDDIGRGRDKYCLARYEDLGNYEIGNCRFITNYENGLESISSLTDEERAKRYAECASFGHLGKQFGVLGGYHNHIN